MKYEFIEDIKKNEYERFVKNHPTKSHFMQSWNFGEISKEKGFIPHFVGVRENKKLVATALLLQKKLYKNICYFYSPRGFVLDFKDYELLKYFTNQIKEYTKKHHSIFTAIDPDVQLQKLDINGIAVDGDNNYALVEYLKSLGYKHLGFNKNFENKEPRYTFRLNLEPSIEEIHKNMHATTRKVLNKGNQYNLDCYIGNSSDLDGFYFTMKETAVREGITPFKYSYYKSFYEIFNKDNESDLYIVRVDINKLKENYKSQIKEIENSISNLKNLKNKEKAKNLLKDYNNKLVRLNKDFELINNIKEDKLVLSSIITVKYGNKVWTVHGGNCNRLRELNANYLIYDKIICDAKKENYQIIDFFGTTGADSDDNKIHGIHLFKKRLGGEYTEFIGEFHLITNKLLYILYQKLLPIYSKIRKTFIKK